MVDGFVIPLNIRCRLPYMDMRLYTDKEWDELPHIHITREEEWDPSIINHEQSDDQDWYDKQPSTPLLFPLFDKHGDLCHHIEAHASCFDPVGRDSIPIEELDDDSIFEDAKDELDDDDDTTLADLDDSVDQCMYQSNFHHLVCNIDSTISEDELISHGPKKITPPDQEYGALKPHFAWLPVEIIKKTFSETTQYV